MLCHLSERTSRNDDASYWISIRKGVFLCGRKYCRYRENNQIPFGLKLQLAHQSSNEEMDTRGDDLPRLCRDQSDL